MQDEKLNMRKNNEFCSGHEEFGKKSFDVSDNQERLK